MGSPSNFGETNGYLLLLTHHCRDHWQLSYKMQLLVALLSQPLARGTHPSYADCSAIMKHWKFKKFSSANSQMKMFCSSLLCSPVPIQPSQGTIFLKQRFGCQPLQRIKPYCKRNLCGEGYGSWQCHARLGILFGELVEMLFQQNPTWFGAVFQRIQRAPSVHKVQKMSYIPCGHAQLLLGFGKMILNGHFGVQPGSKIFLRSSSMYWIRTAKIGRAHV